MSPANCARRRLSPFAGLTEKDVCDSHVVLREFKLWLELPRRELDKRRRR
jgi:hypothetical protein